MAEQQDTPSTSQQLADEIFDAAFAQQEKASAERVAVASEVTRPRAVRVALIVAMPILVAVLLVNFAWQPLISVFEPTPPAAVARQEAQTMLDALVVEIDSFRKDYGALPESLVEIGIPPRGQWSYTARGDSQYSVRGRVYGYVVTFDSAQTTGAARELP